MTVAQAIEARRSVRKYKPDPVPQAHIQQLLTAAMLAPSACNSRPWQFTVVQNPALRQQITEIHPYCNFVKEAPVAIIVSGTPSPVKDNCEFWTQDCGAAIQNLLLQAVELGYGTCWCGIYPHAQRVASFQKLLGITAAPLALIALGTPAEIPPLKGFYDENKVSYL